MGERLTEEIRARVRLGAELVLSNPDMWRTGSYHADGRMCALGMLSCVLDATPGQVESSLLPVWGVVNANDGATDPESAARRIAALVRWDGRARWRLSD